MSQLSRREQLRRRTGDALNRATGDGLGGARDASPRPGDVFAFAETAEHGVQWAVIERSTEPPRRFLVVAADLDPLVGSADVAVEATAPCGALTLRCAFELWLDEADFDPELRTGPMGESALDRARCKRTPSAEGQRTGSALERETDREPEYHDVREDLREAREALLESRRQPSGNLAEVVPFRASSLASAPGRPAGSRRPAYRQPAIRWGALASPYGVAASILLVVTLGLSGAVVRLVREAQEAERLYQQRIVDLEQRVEAADSEVPLVDVPFAWLGPLEQQRGEVRTIRLSAEAPSLVLILEVSDPEPYAEYRLEIREVTTGAEVFASELSKVGVTELSVVLPRRWLAAGEYRLSLYGPEGTRTEPLEEYTLRIDLE